MKEVTQGTLICGLRSRKYPGTTAYGIIISAACDLAQDKIDKIFHLTAVPLKEWLYSDVGFQVVTAGSANGYRKNILSLLEEFDLEWEDIQTYSQEEIDTVFSAYKIPDKRKRTFLSQLEKLTRMTKGSLTPAEKTTVYSDETKNVDAFLVTLFNGGNSHYVFIPQKALTEPLPVGHGLVVDLLELDYFTADLVKKIAEGNIDHRVLSEEDMSTYDKQFALSENDGFAYPTGKVKHPWREYVLQHFSNCFIRIGVKNPEKSEVKGIVEALFAKEDQA